MPNFVRYDPYKDHEFGAGDFYTDSGAMVPLYDPGLSQKILAKNDVKVQAPGGSITTGDPNRSVPETAIDFGGAQIEEAPKKTALNMVQNPSPALQSTASQFLRESNGKLGETRTLPSGEVMTVETHPAAPERGLSNEHPGVTVRSPWNPDEQKALAELVKKYPGTTEEDFTNVFQHESGLNPKAVNQKTGAAGLFQLMPDQAKGLGVGDMTSLSRADQIRAFGEYLGAHNVAPKNGTDIALAVAAPGAVGQPDDAVVYPAGSKAAQQNPAWVDPQTGSVTVGSIKRFYNTQGESSGSPQALAGIQDLGPGFKQITDTKNIRRVEEGTPYSEQDKAGLFARSEAHAQAIKEAYAPVIDAQAEMQKRMITRQQEIQMASDAAQQREDAARQRYEESTQRVKSSVDDVLAEKAPMPFGGNTFAIVLASVAQGMGAYAAAINHTENFAAKAIDTALRRENERWANNLLLKKYKVEQEKDLTSNQWHDYQTQRTERQAQQRMLIDHELQQQLGLSKNADTQKALGLTLEENRNQTEKLNAELERLARGKVMSETITEHKAIQTPTVDEKTYQAYVKGDPTKNLYGRAALDAVGRDMESLVPVLGMKFDPNSATPFTSNPDNKDIGRWPILGSAMGPKGLAVTSVFRDSKEQERLKEAYTRLHTVINAKIYMMSGKQTNEGEAARLAEEFEGLSREDQIRNLNELWKGIQGKKSDLDATYPGMSDTFDQRRGIVNKNNEPAFTPGVGP